MNLIGQKFGRLFVLSQGHSKGRFKYWLCRCECGNKKEVSQHHLRSGGIGSCGCYRNEQSSVRNATHGMSGSKIYETWTSMISRCTIPSSTSYGRYGAIGVRVCDRWLSFENFYADMGDRPTGMSLDRIDPFGNYEPANCRWASKVEQSNNTRKKKRGADQSVHPRAEVSALPQAALVAP